MAGIIRDPAEMKKFAGDLEDYVGNMKSLSSLLRDDITDARVQMRDEMSQKAFAKIDNFRDVLELELPGAEILIEKLRESARILDEIANNN